VLLPILSQTRDASHTRSSYAGMPNWNAKLHGLYITLFFLNSYSSGDLAVDPYSQTAVASQFNQCADTSTGDVIVAGDGPSVLLNSEHVTPVLIEHKILARTLRACDSMSTQKWDGRSERLTEKFYPNLTSKACRLSLGPKNWQGTQAASSSDATSSP